jgi:hypothetical protein
MERKIEKRREWCHWVPANSHIGSEHEFTAQKSPSIEQLKVARESLALIHPMNGIAAVIQAMDREMDTTSAEIASFLTRGDLISYVRLFPKRYEKELQIENIHDTRQVQEKLGAWCEEMACGHRKIGHFEIKILADLFKVPIEIRSHDEGIVLFGEEYPGEKVVLVSSKDGFYPIF